jgi:dTDP-4-amino-4,6-dideoxygalactose transaminase
MRVPFIDLKIQYQSMKDEIDQAIADVIESSAFIGGSAVQNFEAAFAARYGVKHAIGVGSGSDALYSILKMLGVTRGDEVITTAFSWIATAEAISRTGAKPVFVDIEPESYTINPRLIEEKITARTKAILPVHLYGHVAQISEIGSICKKHGLHLVEDCAQSHFSSENGTYAGKFGVASAFSFYPTKNLGAYGNAGCIITNDDHLAEQCRRFSNDGALHRHDHIMEGMNVRMDTLQAAVLSVKLKFIETWNQKRLANATTYFKLLAGIPQIVLPSIRANTTHTFHLFVIRTKLRDELKSFLEQQGIQTSIHYPASLPNMEMYRQESIRNRFPVSSEIQNEVLSLPVYPELTGEQIQFVSEKITSFFARQ